MRLVPIIRVSRDKIPLAWLDVTYVFSDKIKDSQGGRIFTNYSDALADWFRGGEKSSKQIQIVRDKTSGRLCAVEKVRFGDYAICAIGSWVPEELVIGKRPSLQKQDTQTIIASSPQKSAEPEIQEKQTPALDRWWEAAVLKDVPVKAPVLLLESQLEPSKEPSIDVQDSRNANPVTKSTTQNLLTPSKPYNDATTVLPTPESPQPPTSPEQIFENFLLQYLDALYLQRTSLAFFAKGPLTRARIAFTSTVDSATEAFPIVDFTKFLRTIILNLNIVEKKYKEKLPSIAKDTAFGLTDDEAPKTTGKGRKPKKMKLKANKEGLYSCEEQYVRKWWRAEDTDMPSSAENRDQQVKRRVGLLRVRETLLQIVLVLEILSLESSNEWKEANALAKKNDDKEHTIEETTEGTRAVDKAPAKKKRRSRQQDLLIHLDLLVDRMAIWHSLEYEADFLAVEVSKSKDSMKTWGMDMLGAFCMDVILPFFKNRMPEQVTMVVKKFGGPTHSPEKTRRSLTKEKTKDDKKTSKNPAMEKSSQRRSFHRTPTEVDSPAAAKRVPGLVRASTDTSLLSKSGIKREVSEGPLAAIPFLREQKKPRKDSAEKLRLMQRRMINLNDIAPSKKRKAAVDEEVRAAIESIKRPNRGEVSREVAEEREKRVSKAPVRGQKQGQRKILNSRMNIQVAATPKNHRRVDVFRREADASQPAVLFEEPEAIPSTGAASRILDTVKRVSTRDAITETPSIGRVKKLDLFAGGHSRSGSGSLNFATIASQPANKAGDLSTFGGADMVFATPVRPTKRATVPSFELSTPKTNLMPPMSNLVFPAKMMEGVIPTTPQKSIPVTPQKSVRETPGNIYAALGWDDYPVDD
jgi:DNA replication regulator SLD3